MKQRTDHLIHEGLVERNTPRNGGKGLFAAQAFKKGDTLIVFGGRAVSRVTLDGISAELGRHALQIGKEIFLLQHVFEEGEYVNHSCDPNLGVQGQVTLVAMRDIAAEEEVCFDYAMVDMSNADEFDCECGSQYCRHRVTGEDWRLTSLQKRYKGYFGAHVQRAIDECNSGDTTNIGRSGSSGTMEAQL